MADPSPRQAPTSSTTTTTTAADPAARKTYTYYHAGPLFTVSDLTANITLSTLISQHSSRSPIHFHPILPQDLEPRSATPHAIRDADIRALLSCDAALFVYDGAELDAGTVVEYMVAKAADIPAVILRTDFRGGGDQGGEDGEADRWNLMSSFWPRTRGVRVDSMAGYKARLSAAAAAAAAAERAGGAGGVGGSNRAAAEGLMQETVERVVEALEEVVQMPPRLPKELRGPVYDWLALMPGFKDGGDGENAAWAKELLEGKVQKGLL